MTLKRFIAFIAVWLAACYIAISTQTLANDWLINSYRFAPTTVPATATFLQCLDDPANATTYTFTSVNVGTASADRVTLVIVMTDTGSGVEPVNSLTIGGTGATELTDEGATQSQGDIATYVQSNPTGTAENIVVTLAGGGSQVVICVWQLNNVSMILHDSATVNDTNSGVINLNTDVPADGLAFGACTTPQSNSGTTTWSPLTERYDAPGATGAGNTFTVADYDEDGSASVPLTITATITGTGEAICVVISLGPA